MLNQQARKLDKPVLFPEGATAPILRQHHQTCYRHSSLLALAAHPIGNQIIKDIIEPQDEGSFLVSFAGANQTTIEVRPEHLNRNEPEYCAFVSGSLGSRILGAAYELLEKSLNVWENFEYGISDGGMSALVLQHFTNWEAIWLKNDGEFLSCRPKSKEDYPENMSELTRLPGKYSDNSQQLLEVSKAVIQQLENICDNSDAYILTASTREDLNSSSNPLTLKPRHAYALTKISRDENGLLLTLVNPRNSSQAPLELSVIEFVSYFGRLSGVRSPKFSESNEIE